jgi:6-phosphogluconolactonase
MQPWPARPAAAMRLNRRPGLVFDAGMKSLRILGLLALVFAALPLGAVRASAAAAGLGRDAQATEGQVLVFLGTYTGTRSKGIYATHLDLASGRPTTPLLAAEVANPSFLAIHPNRRFLYAVGELGSFAGRKNTGGVSAFAIAPDTGKLTLLNQQPSGGGGPCHVTVDATGKCVLVANYGGGSVAVLPVQEDGRLGEATAFIQHRGSSVNPRRQEGPHAHGIYLDRPNRFAWVPDLGLDQVLVYRFDAAKGTLTPNEPPFARLAPGSGPRHLAFHPKGAFAYVINELLSTMTVFAADLERGTLSEVQTLPTLPADFTGQSTTAEVEVHPSGRFLYGSNRGHDSLAVFSIDEQKGTLALLEHVPTQGKTPRNFGIDPTGRYLLAANQGSDNVVVFHVDAGTGRLKPAGHSIEVGAPVCVKFLPAR